jgi:hypothetical protein
MRIMRFRRRGQLIPPWNMPSDPVKAVFWFMHWLLQVLVRFFWILIIAGVVIESIMNGVVGGVVTLLVGLGLWAGAFVLLVFVNVTTSISQTVSEISRMQRDFPDFTVRAPYSTREQEEGKVVEGTITDLEEERRKRRRE